MVGRSGHTLRFIVAGPTNHRPARDSGRLPGPFTFCRIVILRLQTPHTWLAPRQRAEVMPRTSHASAGEAVNSSPRATRWNGAVSAVRGAPVDRRGHITVRRLRYS